MPLPGSGEPDRGRPAALALGMQDAQVYPEEIRPA
jgi:hypothetical protein